MRAWIYGDTVGEIRAMEEEILKCGGSVAGRSLPSPEGSAFPYRGLTAAVEAAIRGEIDLLLVSEPSFPAADLGAKRLLEVFENYGVLVRSFPSSGISSS